TALTTVAGSGYEAFEIVWVGFDRTKVGSVRADASGAFSMVFRVPATARPGTHTINGTGKTSGELARASCLVQTDWPRFHFDNRNSGDNPLENTLNPSDVGSLRKLWSLTTGDTVDSSPAVVDGVVYVGSQDDNVYALDARTGTQRWVFQTGSGVQGPP